MPTLNPTHSHATPLAVKFCGFTQPSDLLQAVALGVDAVGLVFYPSSPRCVDIATARKLVAQLPPFVSVVALVVNMSDEDFINLCQTVPFDVVQFHGDESASDCQRLAALGHKRWYKAIRVQASDDADSLLAQIHTLHTHGASAVLLDAYHPKKFGGTGEQFDWLKIPQSSPLPIILAGGLHADNVSHISQNPALSAVLYGVDVSGGIERTKGIKCPDKMAQFLARVR